MNPLYPILSLDAAQAYEASVLQDSQEATANAMRQAGRAIGAAILKDYLEVGAWPDEPEVHVLAGKGLNTGDAIVACEVIHEALPGLRVTLVRTTGLEALNPIAADALKRLGESLGEQLRIVGMDRYPDQEPAAVDVMIDGLYGHGFRPPLQPEVAALLNRVNTCDGIALRASVDLPSGIGTGTDPGSFVADFTYIPGVAKEPCFTEANRSFTGRLRFLEIEPFLNQPVEEGHSSLVASPRAYKRLNRFRPAVSDKRDYGHCLIIAGSAHMPGAAQMATMAALQAGAGLVTTFAPANVARYLGSAVPEAMWRPVRLNPEGGFDSEIVRHVSQFVHRAQALLIGPGLVLDRGAVFSLCRIIRETPLPLVIDASALTQEIVTAALGRPISAGPAILTPHLGEYARLQGLEQATPDHEGLIKFSNRNRAITILKGSPTLVSDGTRVVSVAAGGPVLARGGSGDILSGMIAALLARGPADAFSAALNAVSWHGAAADSLARERGSIAVRTTEILAHLATSLRA